MIRSSARPHSYVYWLIVLFFLFFFWPRDFYNAPEAGIDNSWRIAIHLARQFHLRFGKDFLFTYGPLEILETRLPIAVSPFLYLIFDLYYVATFLWILRRRLTRNAGPGTLIYLFLCVVSAGYVVVNQWYFIFFLYFLLSYIRERKETALLIQAAVLSLISLYIKVSLGMTAFGLFGAFLVYSLLFRKMSFRYFAMTVGGWLTLLFLSAWWLNVSLAGYIRGNLELIDYYNDAMKLPLIGDYIPFLYPALITVLITVAVFVAIAWRSFKRKTLQEDTDLLFIYGVLAFSSFVLFKATVVRSGTHFYHYYSYIGPLVGLMFLFSPPSARRFTAVCCWSILLSAIVALNTLPGSLRPAKRLVAFGIFKDRVQDIALYFWGIRNYGLAVRNSDSLRTADNEYRRIIGNGTVDVIPHELSTVYFNGLHYDPRPVVQSYCAYSEYLDSLNARKYRSADAPDYVIFTVGSVDERIPFFDETRTKLAILDRYEVVGRIKDDLILKKKPLAGRLKETQAADTLEASLGQVIPIKKRDGIQVTQVFTHYSFAGNLLRAFYQPARLHMVITLEDNTHLTRQVIKPILADGVILNKYIDSRDEFRLLADLGGRLNTNIQSIWIEPDEPGRWFSPKITLVNHYYSLGSEGSDSMVLAKISAEYSPPHRIDTTQYTMESVDSVRSGWDVIGTTSLFYIQIVGWAIRMKADNSKLVVHPVVRSGDSVYEFPSKEMGRPDLPFAFNRNDIIHSGFTSDILRAALPPGHYQVGVAMYDHKDGKKYLSFTDNWFTIQNTIK